MINNCFSVYSERVSKKSELDEENEIYYFPVRLCIRPTDSGKGFASMDDIAYVEYTLDDTFDNPQRRSIDRNKCFEITFTTYGFFPVKAKIVFIDKSTFTVSGYVEFRVTKEEAKTNGNEVVPYRL